MPQNGLNLSEFQKTLLERLTTMAKSFTRMSLLLVVVSLGLTVGFLPRYLEIRDYRVHRLSDAIEIDLQLLDEIKQSEDIREQYANEFRRNNTIKKLTQRSELLLASVKGLEGFKDEVKKSMDTRLLIVPGFVEKAKNDQPADSDVHLSVNNELVKDAVIARIQELAKQHRATVLNPARQVGFEKVIKDTSNFDQQVDILATTVKEHFKKHGAKSWDHYFENQIALTDSLRQEMSTTIEKMIANTQSVQLALLRDSTTDLSKVVRQTVNELINTKIDNTNIDNTKIDQTRLKRFSEASSKLSEFSASLKNPVDPKTTETDKTHEFFVTFSQIVTDIGQSSRTYLAAVEPRMNHSRERLSEREFTDAKALQSELSERLRNLDTEFENAISFVGIKLGARAGLVMFPVIVGGAFIFCCLVFRNAKHVREALLKTSTDQAELQQIDTIAPFPFVDPNFKVMRVLSIVCIVSLQWLVPLTLMMQPKQGELICGIKCIKCQKNTIEKRAARITKSLNADTSSGVTDTVWTLYPKPNVKQLTNQIEQFGESESKWALRLSLSMGSLLTFIGVWYVKTDNQASEDAEPNAEILEAPAH